MKLNKKYILQHEEIIEYCDGYSVIWKNGTFYVGVYSTQPLNYKKIAEFETLEDALFFYNNLIEQQEL